MTLDTRLLLAAILCSLASACRDPFAAPPAVLEIPMPGGGFNISQVSGAGDLNGDGRGDLILGSGSVDCLAMVHSGADGGVLAELRSPDPIGGHSHRRSTSAIADLDGDSIRDILVGEPRAYGSRGVVWAFSGGDNRLLYTWKGGASQDQLGGSIADGGDVDGDGVHDVLVGADCAPAPDEEPSRAGYVHLYSGATGALIHTLSGGPDLRRFGRTVRGMGDLDADGRADFAIEAVTLDDVYVVRIHSGADGREMYAFGEKTAEADDDAWSASPVGDWNRDGSPDFAVGFSDRLRVFSGADCVELHAVVARAAEVVPIGDFDGDGLPDLAYKLWTREPAPWDRTVYSRVRITSGASGKHLLDVGFPYPFPDLAAAGDVNGDGLGDLLIESGGSVRVYSWTALR